MDSNNPYKYYKSLAKELVNCELCGSISHELVANNDRYGMNIQTVICDKCGFVFTNPRPTPQEMNTFYEQHYREYYFSFNSPYTDNYDSSELRRIALDRGQWLFNFCAGHLKNTAPEKPFVIDLGCGDGAFLEYVRKNIPEANIYGCEPSFEFCRYAHEKAQGEINCQNIESFLDAASRKNIKYHLIVLSHVLEHFFHPKEILLKLRDLIHSDGLLCIEVPNTTSKHAHGPSFLHIAHIFHFTPTTLTLIVNQTGFEIVDFFYNKKHPVDPWAMTILVRKKNVLPVQGLAALPLKKSLKCKKNIFEIFNPSKKSKYLFTIIKSITFLKVSINNYLKLLKK